MKLIKIISLILVLIVPTLTVSAFEFTSETAYNEESSTILAVYTGYEYSQATMMCYDVTGIGSATAETAFIDMEATPIIGLWQQLSNGSFEFPVASDFSGKVVLMIGGKTETPIRMLLNIKEGEIITIDDVISADFDAKGTKRVLVNETDNVEITNNAKLMNAVIDAREGCVIIGDARLSGTIVFTETGEVDPLAGETIKMTATATDEKGGTNYGFIVKEEFDGTQADKHYITIKAESATKTGNRVYDFNVAGLEGATRFKIVITNVPSGTTLTVQ